MTWRVKLLNRPDLPDSFSGTPTYEVAEQIVAVLESDRFDEQELEEAMLLVPGLLGMPGWLANDGRPDPDWIWRAIGRQLPVLGSGTLDILACDSNYFNMHVIELKTGEIRRGDLAQVRDYTLALEGMSPDDLAWHITIHSGRNGVPRIWDASDLLSHIELAREDADEHDPWLSCSIIGQSWRPNIARLARELNVELRTIAKSCKQWREFSFDLLA